MTALTRPRFLLGKTFSDSQEILRVEADAGEAVLSQLAERGHEIGIIETLSPLAGQAGAIMIARDGAISGAHDPRSDGEALGM